MLPKITQLQIPTQITEERIIEGLGNEFLFDFTKGEFVIKDGNLIELTGAYAIKMWIEKLLRSEKRYKIYENTQYGVTIEDLVMGYNYPVAMVESELKREITEACLRHPLIDSIENFKLKKEHDYGYISFQVNLLIETDIKEETKALINDKEITLIDTIPEIAEFLGVKFLTSNRLEFVTTLGTLYVRG